MASSFSSSSPGSGGGSPRDGLSQVVRRRQLAGQLIRGVLWEELTPTQAIARWPMLPPNTYEEVDRSLNAAYQALWYFEADEEKHKTEPFYCDLQLALLKQMADVLVTGEPLPPHLLNQYPENSHLVFYREERGLKEPWLQAKQGWAWVCAQVSGAVNRLVGLRR